MKNKIITPKKIVRSRTRTKTKKAKKKCASKLEANTKMRRTAMDMCKLCKQHFTAVRYRKLYQDNFKTESEALASETLSCLKESMTDLDEDEYMSYKVRE